MHTLLKSADLAYDEKDKKALKLIAKGF